MKLTSLLILIPFAILLFMAGVTVGSRLRPMPKPEDPGPWISISILESARLKSTYCQSRHSNVPVAFGKREQMDAFESATKDGQFEPLDLPDGTRCYFLSQNGSFGKGLPDRQNANVKAE